MTEVSIRGSCRRRRVYSVPLLQLEMSRCDQFHSKVFDRCRALVHLKDERLDLSRIGLLLVHVIDEVTLALEPAVGDLADLLGVESLPRLVVQVLIEGHDKEGVDEVYESVADIASVIQIQGQVEEIISALMVPVYAIKQHILRVLVGNVTDHDRRASILSAQNAVQVYSELRVGVLTATALLVGIRGRRG